MPGPDTRRDPAIHQEGTGMPKERLRRNHQETTLLRTKGQGLVTPFCATESSRRQAGTAMEQTILYPRHHGTQHVQASVYEQRCCATDRQWRPSAIILYKDWASDISISIASHLLHTANN